MTFDFSQSPQLLSTRYVYGFPMTWGSTTTIKVGFPNANAPNSKCRDKNDVTNITMTGQQTITIATVGAANGNDAFTGPGTITVSSNTGTGTSTTFTTSFGIRTCSGTITNSAAVVTGTNTKFITEFAVGDLIGTTTNTRGFYRIVSIESDTSLTIGSTPASPGSTFAGETPKCIEAPRLKTTASGPEAVDVIFNDTSLKLLTSTNVTNSTYTIGESKGSTTIGYYMHVWVGSGSSGTTTYVSSQRTTPFGITNYNDAVRRIGSIRVLNAGGPAPFMQMGLSMERFYTFHEVYTDLMIVNAGTAAGAYAATTVESNRFVPPTTTALYLFCWTTSNIVYVRPRGFGDATYQAAWSNTSGNTFYIPVDGTQSIQYRADSASGYVFCYGYIESL